MQVWGSSEIGGIDSQGMAVSDTCIGLMPFGDTTLPVTGCMVLTTGITVALPVSRAVVRLAGVPSGPG